MIGRTITCYPMDGTKPQFELEITNSGRGLIDLRVKGTGDGVNWTGFQFDGYNRPHQFKPEWLHTVRFHGYLIKGSGKNRDVMEVDFWLKEIDSAD